MVDALACVSLTAGERQGPTLEFYTSVCCELRLRTRQLWRDVRTAGSDAADIYVSAPTGLYPAPLTAAERANPSGQYVVRVP
jgi:hypothetical protein